MQDRDDVRDKVCAIEREMQRIGYWAAMPPPRMDPAALYHGVSFEHFLQFVYLPHVAQAAETGDFAAVPPYRIGLAALRHYDYHSFVEEAQGLLRLCHELESLMPR
jgi:uncharacterized protein YqcC (DUF446 family)